MIFILAFGSILFGCETWLLAGWARISFYIYETPFVNNHFE